MITIFTPNCNQISQSYYDSVINSLQFHQLTCSCHHSACLSVHGYYTRTVKIPEGSMPLHVCRVKCSVCGRTHALLLSSIVPYSQMSAKLQQRICSDFENGHDIYGICELYLSVDENNVKSVVRNYRRHWRERLHSMSISLQSLPELVTSCFAHYSRQFMQIRRMANHLFFNTT